MSENRISVHLLNLVSNYISTGFVFSNAAPSTKSMIYCYFLLFFIMCFYLFIIIFRVGYPPIDPPILTIARQETNKGAMADLKSAGYRTFLHQHDKQLHIQQSLHLQKSLAH